MRKTYRRKPKKTAPKYRANERIIAPEVAVIDDQGQHLGTMTPTKAIALAKEAKLDLVEVSPTSNPPVCKFLNFGQLKYEENKKKQKAKLNNKNLETKGIRLTFKISDHDLEVKQKKASEFLTKGHRVCVELRLRGREKAHFNKAKEILEHFSEELAKVATPDNKLERQGHKLSQLLKPINSK